MTHLTTLNIAIIVVIIAPVKTGLLLQLAALRVVHLNELIIEIKKIY